MNMIELRKDKLILGMALNFTLRDEAGRVLLAKGQSIATAHQLEAIKSRNKVFVEIDESVEGVRVLMSGLVALNRFGAPIKDFSKYLQLEQEPQEAQAPSGSLFKRWDDLESRLTGLLGNLDPTPDFAAKVRDLARDIEGCVAQDSPGSQFLLFNRAVTHVRGYSALHSLLCATLVCSLADLFDLALAERRSLVCAALTMNLAMTRLQDSLTLQQAALSEAQRHEVNGHGPAGKQLLLDAGVGDRDWLDVVELHHVPMDDAQPLAQWATVPRLVKILQTVDRYTAAMSPRKSRTGRTSRDSVRSVVVQAGSSKHDEVGSALLRLLGLCPPGTYVKLTNGETAVVIRRGLKPGETLVASVMNRNNEPIAEPRLQDVGGDKKASIESTVTAAAARINLNMDVMQRLLPK